ncbi:MAG: hypothetical protein N2C14_10005, partial [Planctomycetales bacterium]
DDLNAAAFRSTLAAAHAEMGNYPEAVSLLQQVMDLPEEEEHREKRRRALECFRQGRPYRDE